MNVLLLYPEFPDTFWSFKHALKFIHKKASLPPLGLLTVAALLPHDWGVGRLLLRRAGGGSRKGRCPTGTAPWCRQPMNQDP
jgi:hypothetical protein